MQSKVLWETIPKIAAGKPGGFGLLFFAWKHLETPGKRLDNTWEIECFFAWIHLDKLEIECFFAICSLQNRL